MNRAVSQCFFSFPRFRGHSCVCSSFTGVRQSFCSTQAELRAVTWGGQKLWVLLFFPCCWTGKGNTSHSKIFHTHRSGCLPALGAAPCILVWTAAASLELAAAALLTLPPSCFPVPRLLLGQGTTQYKAFPQATPLSYEITPGLGKTSFTGKGNR